jgi:4-hydroxybenzoate polyprenyltransferase
VNPKLKGYLQLARPANLPTSAADIVAGASLAGAFVAIQGSNWSAVPWLDFLVLLSSSVLLYAAGVILNDVFDLPIDRVERPERPLPSGLIAVKAASFFGASLMSIGVALAFLVHALAGSLALALALAIVLYDALAKKHGFFGPLVMGICRGLNLLLGMSILGMVENWWFALVPVVYIFAITLISRGEVFGKNKLQIVVAGIMYATVVVSLLWVANCQGNLWYVLPFALLFTGFVYLPLFRAYAQNSPTNIKKAVIAGVMGVVLLASVWCAAAGVWQMALLVLLLLPLSKFLAKQFAVT